MFQYTCYILQMVGPLAVCIRVTMLTYAIICHVMVQTVIVSGARAMTMR